MKKNPSTNDAVDRRPRPRLCGHAALATLAFATLDLATAPAIAQSVPPGFVDEFVVGQLDNPTALAFAPDGRLVITEQGGTARLVSRGNLQTAPFARLTVDGRGERGLLGVAFHPNFVANGFVYFYHTEPAVTTAPTRPARNRVTRFVVRDNAVVPASATTVLILDPLSSRTNHNGGAIQFGKDGKLYVAVGDNDNGANAQSLATRLGKMLRLNDDGSIPASNNPTSFPGIAGNTTSGNRAIWAAGLRNPYTFAFHPHSGNMIINDVGENCVEELNRGAAGRNYGWPSAEGPSSNANYTDPIYYYSHASGAPTGCAVTGGTFYSPPQVMFPASYVDKYFFADYCGNWIYYINLANPGTATRFASGLSAPVGLAVGSEGALYYIQRGNGQLRRVRYITQEQQRMVVGPEQFEMAEGTSEVVSVRLANLPRSDTTVTVDRTLSDYLIVSSPQTMVFTAANWDKPQSLVVTAKPDGDTTDESARLSLWSPGMASVRVRVTAVDDDRPAGAPRAIISRPRTGDTVSGSSAEFFGDGRDEDGKLVRGQFYVNNVLRFTDNHPSGHYHIGGDHNMWNTTLLPNGDYTLKLTVFDDQGKSGSHEVRVKIAN